MDKEYLDQVEDFQANRKKYEAVFKRLKKQKKGVVDGLFHEAHEEAFTRIDCLKCANCCSSISPIFKNRDVDRLAKHLRMKSGDFLEEYLNIDSDGDMVLKQTPCPFLGSDNYCSVYEYRPMACREYPHTDAVGMNSKLGLAKKNTAYCPAVVDVIKSINEKMS